MNLQLEINVRVNTQSRLFVEILEKKLFGTMIAYILFGLDK